MNEVFYVCYGSNLHESRFREYLNDNFYMYDYTKNFSLDEQKAWDDIMASNANRELISYRVNLSHDVYFAGNSGRWGGGIAYLDVDNHSCKRVYRAYKITTDEFESLFSQENGYYSGKFDWDRMVIKRETRTDAGFYGRIINLGDIDGVPALTFTSNHSYSEFERYSYGDKHAGYRGYGLRTLNEPGQKYVDVINRGRKETRRLKFKEISPLS